MDLFESNGFMMWSPSAEFQNHGHRGMPDAKYCREDLCAGNGIFGLDFKVKMQ
jgi:hypothetical protein